MLLLLLLSTIVFSVRARGGNPEINVGGMHVKLTFAAADAINAAPRIAIGHSNSRIEPLHVVEQIFTSNEAQGMVSLGERLAKKAAVEPKAVLTALRAAQGAKSEQ